MLLDDGRDLTTRFGHTNGTQLRHTRLGPAGRGRYGNNAHPRIIATEPVDRGACHPIDDDRFGSLLADLVRQRIEQPEKEFAARA